MLSLEKLSKLVGTKKAQEFFEPLVKMCKKYEITNENRLNYFLANILHESSGFSITEESLFYTSLSRLQVVFKGSRLPLLNAILLRNEELLANTVYGGEWGKKNLGNTQAGDGYKFKGRGVIQITGRDGYTKSSKAVFGDLRLVEDPTLMKQPIVSVESACHEWKIKGCNELADKGQFKSCCVKINGGTNGLLERQNWLKKVETV